jgi:hypothetical protein
MATPTPNPLYIACFPLQEYFVNKDTGFPLAGGYVQFFSDPAFTVPKDVFKQSLVDNSWDYTNLGSTLILSSVGTFIDDTGDDIIPFLYPYDAQGNIEYYFIRVWSGDPSVQGSVLQFTRQGWPPGLAQSSSPTDVFESSYNLFTNPQFSTINFVNTVGQTYYDITVAGAGSIDVAPGWSLSYAGSGSLKLSQLQLTSSEITNPSYALQIESAAGVAPIKLTQRLAYSPRVFENNYLSAAVLAKCNSTQSVTVTIDYITSTGNSRRVLSGQTSNNNNFSLLAGVGNAPVLIDVTNTNSPATGYVDMVMTVPSGVIMQFTSVFGCTVQNASSLVTNVQETNAQQTNAKFWYYKPQLEYKPIPSYTLGWNWPLNPCQELGTTVAAVSNTPGLSRYVADETIVFQNVDSAFACTFGSSGMIVNNAADTSFAIIKYFEGARAQTILSTPLCVQLKAGGAAASTTDVIANVSIYWTADATLPDLKSPNFYSLVSAVNNTTGVATVGGGGVRGNWSELPRGNLGAATANLKTANVPTYNFSGWQEANTTPSSTAKYCAIVISVSKLTAGTTCTFEYCTLNAGYIPTSPAATSFGENLTALQQFYEKSYNYNVLPGTGGASGPRIASQQVTINVGATRTNAISSTFNTTYTSKRANPILTYYSSNNGTVNNGYGVLVSNGLPTQAGNLIIGNGVGGTLFTFDIGQNQAALNAAPPQTYQFQTAVNFDSCAFIAYHFTANARLGIA